MNTRAVLKISCYIADERWTLTLVNVVTRFLFKAGSWFFSSFSALCFIQLGQLYDPLQDQ